MGINLPGHKPVFSEKSRKGRVIRLIPDGRIGDALLSTPIFETLKKKNDKCRIEIFCRNKTEGDVFKGNPFIDRVRTRSLFNDLRLAWFIHLKSVQPIHFASMAGVIGEPATYRTAHLLGIEPHDNRVQIYLSEQEDKRAIEILSHFTIPIVMQAASRSGENKQWPKEFWEELVDGMKECTFIQLGLENEQAIKGAIDLRGKTSFREALAIIKNARSFVGVDSSLAHATNAFDIPGVVLFGPTSPRAWGHDNNTNLYKPLRCSPCFDMLVDGKCPYHVNCMRGISVKEVREALLSQLGQTNRNPTPLSKK